VEQRFAVDGQTPISVQEMPEGPWSRGRPVSDLDIKNLGLSQDSLKMVRDLEELKKSPPNIIIADAIVNVGFIQNFFKHQYLKKKVRYCMGLGVYQQLHFDIQKKKRILRPAPIKFKNMYKPYRGEDLTDKTLLVWRTGGIGDLEFILPNLIYLKDKYPSCTIFFACGPQYQAMVENWECVDLVLDLPFPFSYLIKSHYHLLFEGVIERCLAAQTTNAYRLFTTWAGLNLPDELLVPVQTAKEERVEECRQVLKNWGIQEKGFVVIQTRASSPIRTPRPALWKRIIDEFTKRGHNVVITDTPRMKEEHDKLIKTLERQNKVFNFSEFSKTLDSTIALVSISKIAISTDTALLHLAASLSVPALGLYGPFPGKIRLATYKNVDWVDCNLPCSPCFIHGHYPCKNAVGNYSPCYDILNVEDFADRAERLLENRGEDG